MKHYKDADEILRRLPDDLPYKASVKRVLMQAPDADVVEEISRDIIEPLWDAYKNCESKETVLLVALICESINVQLKKKYTEGEK